MKIMQNINIKGRAIKKNWLGSSVCAVSVGLYSGFEED
jgi:hypothetical protein